MRRLVLTLTTLAVVGLAAGTALAGHGYGRYGRGYGRNIYGGYGGYNYSRSWGPNFGSGFFSQQLRRVQANHSRYRYNYHPRSYYNSPPHPYDYWGW